MGRALDQGQDFEFHGPVSTQLREIQAAHRHGYSACSVYSTSGRGIRLYGSKIRGGSRLAEARKLNPKLTIKWYRAADRLSRMFYEGLRKAGLPEE